MKEVIGVGLPDIGQPFSWAVKVAGTMVFTAHGPVRTDGTNDTGTIDAQARPTRTPPAPSWPHWWCPA